MPDLPLITDKADPAVQRILDIMKPGRPVVRTTLIEDRIPLMQAITTGLDVLEVYGTEAAPPPEEVLAACRERGVAVRLVEATVFNQLFKGEKKPKVFGVLRIPPPARFADLADRPGDVVVLDGVKIVGNIGAIVRTSYALGASGLVLLDSDLTSVADRRLIRASRGYVFTLPVVLADRGQLAGFLGAQDLPLVVFDAGGAVRLDELGGRDERLALLFGGELRGASNASLDELSAGRADGAVLTASIPMIPAVESLNVSVATGVALGARATRNLAVHR